jgi:type IV pilus assembly protein PilV
MLHLRSISHARRGYTAVELVMAIGIFAVGVTGVFAMQRVTSGSNAHAKNVAIATFAAESWLEQLAVDGTLWTQTAVLTSGNTTWLDQLGTNNTTGWFLPASSGGTFGPGFDALGAYAANTSAAFCTHLRLTRLLAEPNGLVRAEVRVFWPKPGPAYGTYCPATATDVVDVGAATDFLHFVYKTTVIRQTGGI